MGIDGSSFHPLASVYSNATGLRLPMTLLLGPCRVPPTMELKQRADLELERVMDVLGRTPRIALLIRRALNNERFAGVNPQVV